MRVEIERFEYAEKQTLGELRIFQGDQVIYNAKTLELSDKGNQKYISCIPEGVYTVTKKVSKGNRLKFGKCFEVLDVFNRSGILIHIGNFFYEIRGCILVGQSHKDINHDGLRDVKDSGCTINDLYDLLPDEFRLEIFSVC